MEYAGLDVNVCPVMQIFIMPILCGQISCMINRNLFVHGENQLNFDLWAK